MKKSSAKRVGLIIVMLGAIVIGFLARYGFNASNSKPRLFVKEKEIIANKLYEEITSADLEAKYPETPEKAMDLYSNINLLIFGDMIADETIYQDLVKILRKLYSNEIITANSEENQYQKLMDSIKILKETNVFITETERGASSYTKGASGITEACVISVRQYANNVGFINWDYHFMLQDGFWKIHSWARTDL